MKNNIFELSSEQLQDIALALKDRVKEGLSKEDMEVQCIPTYITPRAEDVEGKAVVLDLGGTNYRVASVNFTNGEASVHPENGWKKDLSVMKTSGFTQEQLFQELADPILETKRDSEVPIGYCFSYPAGSLPNGDAELLRWTKGVDIKEMVNKPVGQPLLDYLNDLGKPGFTGIKVINDTVASLFAGLTDRNYDAYIGLIVGTGTNMATFIPSDKITKLEKQYMTGESIPVNLESGNFNPPHLTIVDKTVDMLSDAPGRQRFEKAVSGMYLGEILKAAFPLNEFEEKFDAKRLTVIMGYPDIHKEDYVQIARWIYIRSAKLVAASLAGLISLLVEQRPEIRKIRLIAEGSLFWSSDRMGDSYQVHVSKELESLLAALNLRDVTVDIGSMDNANLIGTAIAALS